MSCTGVCSYVHDNNYSLANSPTSLPNSARGWGGEDDEGEGGEQSPLAREHSTGGRMAMRHHSPEK